MYVHDASALSIQIFGPGYIYPAKATFFSPGAVYIYNDAAFNSKLIVVPKVVA
jgi:hypothetical protein